MRGCISTSRLRAAVLILAAALAVYAIAAVMPVPAWAADEPGGEVKTDQPEEQDFTSTPFTEYAEFDETSDEDDEAKFFQYGRFFGVSMGLGIQSVTGNRGQLWTGGFPVIDFRFHYWFDFNFGLDLGIYTAPHSYAGLGEEVFQVNMIRIGTDVKYYFETRNLAATLAFANPYVLLGIGSYSKTETSSQTKIADADSSFGLAAGAGLEFALSPKKAYFNLEAKLHVARFKDSDSKRFGFDDLGGQFVTVTGGFLFTW